MTKKTDKIDPGATYCVVMAETVSRKVGDLKRGHTYEMRGAYLEKVLDKVASYSAKG